MEPIITQRNDRYVLPVKPEFRSQLRGIVHDVSSTGATLFVEPLETVELGNAWKEAQLEERREVERILRRLSAEVGANATEILAAIGALAQIDLALAKARLAAEQRANIPLVAAREAPDGSRPPLKLIDARHPLLTVPPVPISLTVGGPIGGQPNKEIDILLISGPNTGGKTVGLKTSGLLTLMAQCGLAIPAAEGSQVPVFDGVYADIGDEQSIEQSLSTFSSHLHNIISALGVATDRSLVLLDELAAGTDPTEGSALARALLLDLLSRHATVIATTHHSELKGLAHVTPRMQNANVWACQKTSCSRLAHCCLRNRRRSKACSRTSRKSGESRVR
jgi:DNA mismatch repair protein MutS2